MIASPAPQILKTEIVNARFNGKEQYAVFTIPSSSGKSEYRVDVTTAGGRCSCKSWIFSRVNPATGYRPLCKHLRGLGFTEMVASK